MLIETLYVFALLCIPTVWHGVTFWMFQRHRTTRHPLLTWPAQTSGLTVALAVVLLVMTPEDGLILALIGILIFPPIVLIALFATSSFMVWLLVFFGLVALGLFASVRRTRALAPTFAALTMAIGMVLTADIYWDRQMCTRAAHHGLTDIQRAPFVFNLLRANSKLGREPYAIAKRDDELWDWGYSREDFVRYRGDIPGWADMRKFEQLDCAG